jgi:hypothetical protein
MATHVGDIFFDAKINRSEYDKGLKGLNATASKIGASIGRKLSAGFAVAGLTKFVKDATKAGASLNAMGTIIDASLPHMTKQVDDFAKSAGGAFGLSETQAKGFVGKFASMASAMGYTENEAYKMSTALTGLAGDVASYYHITQDEAFAKLGAVFTGETESLKQLGVIMTQNALDAFALEHGYGRVTAQMSELEKTTLRYQFVMDRLKLASGDFAKYANTWSGSIATIKLNWANFMAVVGQGMINILLPLLQLIARVSNALTALASRFLGWTKRLRGIKDSVSGAFGKKTQKDLKVANTGIGNVGSGLGGAGKQAKGAKKAVQALKRELLGFDKITKLTGEKGTTSGGVGGGGVSGGGGSVGDMGLGDYTEDVSALGSAVDYLSQIKLPDSLTQALDHLKQSLGGLFDTLRNAGQWALDNVLKPLGEWFLNRGLPVQIEAFSSAIDLVNNALKLVGAILRPLWEPLIKPFLLFLLNYQADKIEKIGKVFGYFAEVLDKARIGWQRLVEKGGEFKAILVDKFSEKWESLKETWENVKDKVATAKLQLSDKFSEAWKKIKEKWTSVKSKTATQKLVLHDKFSGAWKKVKSAWNKLKSKTVTLSLGFKNAITSKWNAIASKVNSARNKSAIVKGLFPKPLPYLAQGGYVKANTPQLAVIGDNKREGEIVAPESKLQAMANQASNNQQVVLLLQALLTAVNSLDLDVQLDGESIKQNTVRRINQHTRATGQLELII